MLNDADGQGGGNASDYEARETVAYAEALLSVTGTRPPPRGRELGLRCSLA